MSSATTWFDEVITPEERLDCVEYHGHILWTIIQFDRYLDMVFPADLMKIG